MLGVPVQFPVQSCVLYICVCDSMAQCFELPTCQFGGVLCVQFGTDFPLN